MDTIVEIERNPREFVLSLLETQDADEVFQNHFNHLKTLPGGGFGLLEIVKNAVAEHVMLWSLHEYEEQHSSLTKIMTQIKSYLDMALRLWASQKSFPKWKPANVYRFLMPTLKYMKNAEGFEWVKDYIIKLELEQSLPIAELDAQPFVDGYTGEVDEMEEFFSLPASDVEEDVVSAMVNGEEEKFTVFSGKSEGFNYEDGLDEVWYDDRMTKEQEPMWMTIQHDLSKSEEFGLLTQEAKPFKKDLRQERELALLDAAFELGSTNLLQMKTNGIRFEQQDNEIVMSCVDYIKANCFIDHREFVKKVEEMASSKQPAYRIAYTILGKIYEIAREKLRKSQAAHDFIEFLDEKMYYGASPVDVYIIFAAEQHALGFMESDATYISFHNTEYSRFWNTMFDFAEECGDDVLELNSEAYKGRRFTMKDIDEFHEETLELYKNTGSFEGSPKNHPAFIHAYMKAATEGLDKGSANEAGWNGWREYISPFGQQAYLKARSEGKSYEDAMLAFKQGIKDAGRTVVSIKPTGLVLASGRFIDWYIAKMKVQGNELDLSEEKRKSLKEILLSKGWGKQLASVL